MSRQSFKISLVMLLLGIGLLGAYFGAHGQDVHQPWPPRPVRPPEISQDASRYPAPRPVTPPEVAPTAVAPQRLPDSINPQTMPAVPPTAPTAIVPTNHQAQIPAPLPIDLPPPAPTPLVTMPGDPIPIQNMQLPTAPNTASPAIPAPTPMATIPGDPLPIQSEQLPTTPTKVSPAAPAPAPVAPTPVAPPMVPPQIADQPPPAPTPKVDAPKPIAMPVVTPAVADPLPPAPTPKADASQTTPEIKTMPVDPQPDLIVLPPEEKPSNPLPPFGRPIHPIKPAPTAVKPQIETPPSNPVVVIPPADPIVVEQPMLEQNKATPMPGQVVPNNQHTIIVEPAPEHHVPVSPTAPTVNSNTAPAQKPLPEFRVLYPIRGPVHDITAPRFPDLPTMPTGQPIAGHGASGPVIPPGTNGGVISGAPHGPIAHTPGAPTGIATPQVTVDKRGPAQMRAGQPLQYVIIVRNIGQSPANQVRVEDEIPAGARVTYADPAPTSQTDRVVWTLPVLLPGAEKQLKVELLAQGSGEVTGTTSVMVATTTGTRTRLTPDTLTLSVTGPATVPLGFPVMFEVVVTNQGKQTATGMVLFGSLPVGLTHVAGREIEADVGDLPAGQSKTFKMQVTAAQPGRHTADVKITAHGGAEAKGQATVQVTAPNSAALLIRQSPSARLFAEREGEIRLDIINNLKDGAKNVTVMNTLPDGVEFLSASDRGLFRPDTRTAHWLIDYLAPGDTRTLTMKVQASSPGQFDNEAIARSEGRQETRSLAKVQVDAMSALVLQVNDRDKAVEVGKQTLYEIKVVNHGSGPATGVQVRATLPEGMAAAKVQGPTVYRVDGQEVVFATLPKLQPQGEAVFLVSALAQSPGDRRFRAQVLSDQDPTPIAREERTYVYRD